MTTYDNDDRFAEYLDQFVMHLEGVANRPTIDHLSVHEQQELSAMFRIIEANWSSEMELPPFEEDPVALALGLVQPVAAGPPVVVAGSRVRALRQAGSLSRSGLATAIATHGWPITPAELALLERADAQMLPASHGLALAQALLTGVDALAPSPGDLVEEFLTWLYSDQFDQVVTQWAAEHERAVDEVAEEIRTKMLAPARRGSGPSGRAQWLQTLHAILEAME